MLRPVRLDELGQVCALVNRSERHDGVPRVLVVDELEEEIGGPHVDVELDTRVALAGDEIVGWAHIWHVPSGVGLERAYIFGDVDPVHRDQGVGRALMAWGVERGTSVLRATGNDLPKYLRVDAYDFRTQARRLFARFGFEPVRWFEELLRPLDPLPEVSAPDGIEILDWADEHDGEARAVKNTAFADHWGSTAVTEEKWHDMVHGYGGRPDLSVVAVERATGRVVGFCLNHHYPADEALTGRRDGYIDNLGTLPAWRGRGVASALINMSLRRFAAAGFTHALLDVDSDSPTGAAHLYRGLGFESAQQSITSQIVVDEGRVSEPESPPEPSDC